jgi:iron only hydrogenase large subunit-like protein
MNTAAPLINQFHHALQISDSKCIGCTHCVRTCPTQALYIDHGKACLFAERCVDCGECLRKCPVNAISIGEDDLSNIFRFKRRIALVPSVFFGQFKESITDSNLYSLLLEIGFTDVFEVENTVEYINKLSKEYMHLHPEAAPYISTYCPAIVRLIQVRFPALLQHLIPVKTPLEISAYYYRNLLVSEGNLSTDIGIFYVTPCAAKIAAVKSPVAEKENQINGVINLNSLYNNVLKIMASRLDQSLLTPGNDPLAINSKSILWSLSKGESSNYDSRCLAIDEIHNVIEFLERLENERLDEVNFIELRACDQSCAGGVLTVENRFLTVEKLNKRAEKTVYHANQINAIQQQIFAQSDYLKTIAFTDEIPPRSIMKFDDNYQYAMDKYSQYQQFTRKLPMVDCGLCGFQSCEAFSEQVVRNNFDKDRCVFVQKAELFNGNINPARLQEISVAVWGEEKYQINQL